MREGGSEMSPPLLPRAITQKRINRRCDLRSRRNHRPQHQRHRLEGKSLQLRSHLRTRMPTGKDLQAGRPTHH